MSNGVANISGSRAAENLNSIASRIRDIASTERYIFSFDFDTLKDRNKLVFENRLIEQLGRNYLSIYTFHLGSNASIDELATKA